MVCLFCRNDYLSIFCGDLQCGKYTCPRHAPLIPASFLPAASAECRVFSTFLSHPDLEGAAANPLSLSPINQSTFIPMPWRPFRGNWSSLLSLSLLRSPSFLWELCKNCKKGTANEPDCFCHGPSFLCVRLLERGRREKPFFKHMSAYSRQKFAYNGQNAENEQFCSQGVATIVQCSSRYTLSYSS